MGNYFISKSVIGNYPFVIMSILYVDSVIKSFANKQVLTDIFITCKPGDIVGLLGRNGAGKSTLLKIIFGSIPADNKFVKIDNKIAESLSDTHNLVKYLPQDHFLPNHVKIKNLINLFCDKEKAERIGNNSHIKPLLEKKSRQLSGGEKRLVEIFLIVYSKAKYILIDEPFKGIAPVNREEIKDLIKEESKHKGFIITDHDYRNIMDVVTKTILLHDGGTKQIGNKNELKYWGYLPEMA